MKSEAGQHFVKAWQFQGLLLESYHYARGPSNTLPPHSHEQYQFTLSLTHTGEYYYRGANHPHPVGSVSVIHPGEVHQTRPPAIRLAPRRFRVMYVPIATLRQAAAEVAGRDVGLPFFAEPTMLDRKLTAGFLSLHQALEGTASQLESESRLLLMLTRLIVGYAADHPPLSVLRVVRTAVRRVQEYLQENYAQNVSLAELARIADLSAFHLTRVFVKEVGLTPHAYQTQVRIARAKTLLTRGLSPAQVAVATGFYDQSHFGGHFKRLVGVTPGKYAGERKNLLYKDI